MSGTEHSTRSLSIVIVTWNCAAFIGRCIRSFWPVDGLDAELIIVDNDSADGTGAVVREAFPNVIVIDSGRNAGFAAGVNIGLAAASGRYVALLNPDTVVGDGAFQRLVQYANDHPECGMLGPRILSEDGSVWHSCIRFPTTTQLFAGAMVLDRLFPNHETFAEVTVDVDEPRAVEAVAGCCMVAPRASLEDLGGMDERFFMYSEEVDLCKRTREAGREVHHVPDAHVVHLGRGSADQLSLPMFLEYRRSMLRYFDKHHGRAALQRARLWLALFLVMRIPYWGLRALAPRRKRALDLLRNYVAGLRFLFQPLNTILAGRVLGPRQPAP